ncbi:MAG: hypothetical protein V2A74_03710, partial [bacterium]
DAQLVAVIGIISALVLFVIVVGLLAWFNHVRSEELQRKVIAAPSEEIATLRAHQQSVLNSYRVVDRDKGIVAIPIDIAMELEVRDLASLSRPAGEKSK